MFYGLITYFRMKSLCSRSILKLTWIRNEFKEGCQHDHIWGATDSSTMNFYCFFPVFSKKRTRRLLQRSVQPKQDLNHDLGSDLELRLWSDLSSVRLVGCSAGIYIYILAVSPRHACGWKGADLNKKSFHEIGAPYITPNFIIRRTAVLRVPRSSNGKD